MNQVFRSFKHIAVIILLPIIGIGTVQAAGVSEYSYQSQKHLIPKELGRVYLGMTLRNFANEVSLNKAVVTSSQFDFLELEIRIEKKTIKSLRVRVHGLTKNDRARMLLTETDSDNDVEIERILVSAIPKNGIVYSMYVTFQPRFKLERYVMKRFGSESKRGNQSDDQNQFDLEWHKETSDGLKWLIRSLHEGDKRELQLHGRIPGSEWDPNAGN